MEKAQLCLNYVYNFTARKWSCEKVIFLQVSVSHSVHGRGTHVTITSPPSPKAWDLGTRPPATDIWWSSWRRGTYSHPPAPPEIWDMGTFPCYWHLVDITGDMFKFVHFRTSASPLVLTSSEMLHLYFHSLHIYFKIFTRMAQSLPYLKYTILKPNNLC